MTMADDSGELLLQALGSSPGPYETNDLVVKIDGVRILNENKVSDKNSLYESEEITCDLAPWELHALDLPL